MYRDVSKGAESGSVELEHRRTTAPIRRQGTSSASTVVKVSVRGETVSAGGKGVFYIDHIRLYPPRCRADVVQPAKDYNDDCIVDYGDLQYIVNKWLIDNR